MKSLFFVFGNNASDPVWLHITHVIVRLGVLVPPGEEDLLPHHGSGVTSTTLQDRVPPFNAPPAGAGGATTILVSGVLRIAGKEIISEKSDKNDWILPEIGGIHQILGPLDTTGELSNRPGKEIHQSLLKYPNISNG